DTHAVSTGSGAPICSSSLENPAGSSARVESSGMASSARRGCRSCGNRAEAAPSLWKDVVEAVVVGVGVVDDVGERKGIEAERAACPVDSSAGGGFRRCALEIVRQAAVGRVEFHGILRQRHGAAADEQAAAKGAAAGAVAGTAHAAGGAVE